MKTATGIIDANVINVTGVELALTGESLISLVGSFSLSVMEG